MKYRLQLKLNRDYKGRKVYYKMENFKKLINYLKDGHNIFNPLKRSNKIMYVSVAILGSRRYGHENLEIAFISGLLCVALCYVIAVTTCAVVMMLVDLKQKSARS